MPVLSETREVLSGAGGGERRLALASIIQTINFRIETQNWLSDICTRLYTK